MNNGKRVSLFTLGCRLNQAETALIADSFRERGYAIVPFGAPAEVSVINTCSVTARADAHCRNAIRRARKVSPEGVVAAVGCYAQSETEAVKAVLGVDYIVGTDRKLQIAEIIDRDSHPATQEIIIQRTHTDEPLNFEAVGYYPESTRANIKIQDGCDFNCAFCILPRVRGRGRSRRMGDIIDEATKLAERGHKELVLAGVSIGSYAAEDCRLVDVAKNIEQIDAVKRVRLSSIEPSTIDDNLLRWMAESPKACRHLHIPVQSGDDHILKAMRREYTLAEFKRLIDRATELMPDIGLGTDIIVGFPGEGEAEFRNTVRLVEELPFSYLHVFSYSDRPKTTGMKLPGKNNPETIKNHSDFMHEIGEQKKRIFAEKHIGRQVEVLVERRDENGLWNGFTSQYLKVYFAAEDELQNQIVVAMPFEYNEGELISKLDSIMCDDAIEKALFGGGDIMGNEEGFFRIDTPLHAVDSLEKLAYFLKNINEDPINTKWAIIAADLALYGFMISNLGQGSYKLVETERGHLIDFKEALKRVRKREIMGDDELRKPLLIDDRSHQEILRFHREYRNPLEHFKPTSKAVSFSLIIKKLTIIIDAIKQLALNTGRMGWGSNGLLRHRSEIAIASIEDSLLGYEKANYRIGVNSSRNRNKED